MDLSLIGAASAALSAARDIGKAAIGIRDFNELATTVAQINDQLLKAQDSLFAHQGQLFSLQQEVFDLTDALRKKEAALVEAQQKITELQEQKLELGEYERFRLGGGAWAYRRKDTPAGSEDFPTYCANCFENAQLSLLQPGTGAERTHLVCHRCHFKMRRG